MPRAAQGTNERNFRARQQMRTGKPCAHAGSSGRKAGGQGGKAGKDRAKAGDAYAARDALPAETSLTNYGTLAWPPLRERRRRRRGNDFEAQ